LHWCYSSLNSLINGLRNQAKMNFELCLKNILAVGKTAGSFVGWPKPLAIFTPPLSIFVFIDPSSHFQALPHPLFFIRFPA